MLIKEDFNLAYPQVQFDKLLQKSKILITIFSSLEKTISLESKFFFLIKIKINLMFTYAKTNRNFSLHPEIVKAKDLNPDSNLI
jgi:hypothetical protein